MGYRERVIADGAVAYWRFEETSGTNVADDTGHGYVGTYDPGVTLGVPGSMNDVAVTRTGSPGLVHTVLDTPALRIPSTLTLECWLYPPTIDAAAQRQLFARGSVGTATANYALYHFGAGSPGSEGQVVLYASPNGVWQTLHAPYVVSLGTWHHLVVTYDAAAGAKLYDNGVLVRTGSVTGILPTTPNNFSQGIFTNHLLNDSAVYDVVLTPAQVKAHYLLGTLTGYAARVVEDGASNYWRLGEASGLTAVDSIGGANGTISGGVTLNQPGAVSDGNAAFKGDGVNGIVTAPAVTLGTTFSLECWVNLRAISIANLRVFVVNGTSVAKIQIQQNVAQIHGWLGAAYSAIGVLTLGAWAHVVLTADGTGIRFYTNGVTGATAPATDAVGTGTVTFLGGQGNFFDGSIDEVAIYPRALTATEIARHYALGTFSPYGQRVLADGASNYWRLGETSGLVAVDSVGGKNGTISGGVTLNQPGALVDGNTAMTFDGVSGQIDAPSTVLNFGDAAQSFTIEWWMTGAYGSSNAGVFQKSSGGNSPFNGFGIGIGLRQRSGGMWEFTRNPGVNPAPPRLQVYGLLTNAWSCLVVTYNASTGLLTGYVNGVAQATASMIGVNAGPYTDSYPFLIGNLDNLRIAASLDEVAIYPRALTAAEIAAHYAIGTFSLESVMQSSGYSKAAVVAPSDTVNITGLLPKALYVGSGGNVAVLMNKVAVVFSAVAAGAILPVAATRVNATGTTASLIVVLGD